VTTETATGLALAKFPRSPFAKSVITSKSAQTYEDIQQISSRLEEPLRRAIVRKPFRVSRETKVRGRIFIFVIAHAAVIGGALTLLQLK
jgi:hypothetical protein